MNILFGHIFPVILQQCFSTFYLLLREEQKFIDIFCLIMPQLYHINTQLYCISVYVWSVLGAICKLLPL